MLQKCSFVAHVSLPLDSDGTFQDIQTKVGGQCVIPKGLFPWISQNIFWALLGSCSELFDFRHGRSRWTSRESTLLARMLWLLVMLSMCLVGTQTSAEDMQLSWASILSKTAENNWSQDKLRCQRLHWQPDVEGAECAHRTLSPQWCFRGCAYLTKCRTVYIESQSVCFVYTLFSTFLCLLSQLCPLMRLACSNPHVENETNKKTKVKWVKWQVQQDAVNLSQLPGRQGQDSAIDPWGEEGEEEDTENGSVADRSEEPGRLQPLPPLSAYWSVDFVYLYFGYLQLICDILCNCSFCTTDLSDVLCDLCVMI